MTNVTGEPDVGALAETLRMTAGVSASGAVPRATLGDAAVRSDGDLLRALVTLAGICWSVLFVVIGLRYGLQMYADGSIFSYSVAVQDAWAFHWQNISGRLFVYVFSYLPAETYVELTGDARGGIAVYGFLFFVAQLLGLSATFVADRSQGRIIFGYACLSTACLCPLVFGFPTEMWAAHALFWPTLAVCHYARASAGAMALVFALLLALVFTHGGALILGVGILATLLLRGRRDAAFMRAAGAFLVVISIWAAVKVALPPDPYVGSALRRAALHVFDISILGDHLMLLLFGVLASYGVAFCALRRFIPTTAHVYAALLVALALAAYWLWFDDALHAGGRYHLRTVLLVATPVLGALAAAHALHVDGRLSVPVAIPRRLIATLTGNVTAGAIAGAVLLVMLVHAVETTKFVTAWINYKAAVRTLAMGAVSDPALGDGRFVSSDRIGADLNRLSWFSTTHFLSVLVAPALAPARLVVDPSSNYFWLSCTTATANQEADRVVPVETRRLVRVYACLHRRT
jgi:hypothetical protein